MTAEVDFDHFSPEFAADPAGVFQQVREICPVARTGSHGGFWVVTGHPELARMAVDDATFSSARHPADSGMNAVLIPDVPSPILNIPIELDPPEAQAYRALLTPIMSPATSTKTLRPLVGELTRYFIDQVIESGRCDLIRDVASPVPAMFTMIWLGLPTERWRDFAEAQHGIVANAPGTPEFQLAVELFAWQEAFIVEWIGRKRTEPGDDVISYLTRQRLGGRPLTDRQILETVWLLVSGGVDTTTSLAGQALMYLDEHPGQSEQLLESPEYLDSATEEFLRVFCPITALARTVTTDVEVSGQRLKAGDKVLLAWSAANRDPREFEDPEKVRLDRRPNRHTTFGLGLHRCVGSNLARDSFKEMLVQVLQRLPSLRIDRENASSYPVIGINSGWSRLPATFDPASREGDGQLPSGAFGLGPATAEE
jgi:cytochrome P450